MVRTPIPPKPSSSHWVRGVGVDVGVGVTVGVTLAVGVGVGVGAWGSLPGTAVKLKMPMRLEASAALPY